MRIKCIRPVLLEDGAGQLIFYFDTETKELHFDDKDLSLLLKVYHNTAIDLAELTDFEIEEE